MDDEFEALANLSEQVDLATKGLGEVDPFVALNALLSVTAAQAVTLRDLIVDLQARGVID